MSKSDNKAVKVINKGPLGFVFFMAFIGAAVYFVHQSHGFGGFLLAILKACVWPAYAVYNALLLMHA